MIRVTKTLVSIHALALGAVLALAPTVRPAFAGSEGTPLVATRSYKVCGSWKNKLAKPFSTYTIANYNDFVPMNVTIGPLQEIPASVWQFFYDGIARGYPYNDAFLANLDIIDQTGVSRPQMIYGSYKQKFKQLTLVPNTTLPAEAQFLSTAVNTSTEQIVTTAPNTFVNASGPFRFRRGTVAGNALPNPLNETTNYYIRWVTASSFQVSLLPGGAAINLITRGTGTHTIYPFGDPLANAYKLLSQLYLLGGLGTTAVLDPVAVEKVKLKLSLDRAATQLGVKLMGRTLYDITTDGPPVVENSGGFDYRASSGNCFVP